MLLRSTRRHGASVVEMAIIAPVTILLLFGLIITGLGVFRYQEVASLAREGSRWASVHGTMWAQTTGKTAATATDVYNKGILPEVVALNTSKLSYSVTWDPDNSPGSQVTVTVTYNWMPEALVAGPITLSSTSTVTMTY